MPKSQTCTQCGQTYEDGVDGFCRDCVNKAQTGVLANWNDIGERGDE